MKKVLIITYYWPPSGGAGVQRWLKFTKYLPEFGWKPIVYTPENPEAPADDHSLLKDVYEQTEIIKRPIREPYTWYKKLIGQKKDEKINAGFLDENKKSSFIQNITTWIRGNFFIPDARIFWIKPSIKFLSAYLTKNPVDIVVTTGPPHSMHMIGLGLKNKLDIPWIADFRDPWTGIDFYEDLMLTKWADSKHHRLEKSVLTKCDKIVSVSKNTALDFNKICNREINVITNGFDVEDFEEHETSSSHFFSVVHVGAINKDRNHKVFWEAFSILKMEDAFKGIDWKIQIIGKADFKVKEDIERYGLGNNVEFVKYIPHKEVISYEINAGILYLSINNTPYARSIMPGKTFEYLAARRPILAIGPPDGEVGMMFSDLGTGDIIDFSDVNGLVNILKIYISKFKQGQLKAKPCDYRQFSRRNLTGKIVEIFNTFY